MDTQAAIDQLLEELVTARDTRKVTLLKQKIEYLRSQQDT